MAERESASAVKGFAGVPSYALARRVAIGAVMAACVTPLNAQAAPEKAQDKAPAASFQLRLAVDKERASIGQAPKAVMTVYNIGSEVVLEPDADAFRLHVEGPAGEPAKTMWYRQLLREPGLPSLAITLSSPLRQIFPGLWVEKGYPLEAYYDLRLPGKYSVFLEVRDPSGIWLTTNTAQFEMETPPQPPAK